MSQEFELPAELTIYSVMQTRDALLAYADQARSASDAPLELSARDVTQVDAAGLQLLAALANTPLSWTLVHSSDVFTEACQTMGLAHWLPAASGEAEVTA